MRLHRTLFYIMLGVFMAGVTMAVFIKPENVAMSRIATGLITGSFIGLVSSIVNYVYAWQKFMTDIFNNADKLSSDLDYELIRSLSKIDDIEKNGKQFIINTSLPYSKALKLDSKYTNERRYDKYRLMFETSQYAPLFFRKKTLNVLDELEGLIDQLGMIVSYSRAEYNLALLGAEHLSIEEEKLLIGDRDSFYDFQVRRIYNWRDYTAHCMRRLTVLMEKLQKSLKPIILGEEYSVIPELLASSTDRILKNIPDRNPLEEVGD